MKLLILTCLLAVSRAAPLAGPDDDDDDKGRGPDYRSGSHVYHSGVPHSVFTGYQPVSYAAHGPISFAPGSHVFQSGHPTGVVYSSGAHFEAVRVAKFESGESGSVAVHGSPVAYHSGASFIPNGQVSYSVQQAAGPTVTTYNTAHAAVVPAQATQYVAAAPAVAGAHAAPVQYHAAVEAAPAVATVHHATPVHYHAQVAAVEAAPAVATVHHAAPVHYHAQVATIEAAPAVATVQHHTVQQAAVAAVPTAITYQSEHTVELPAKEIDVPVQNTYVYRPVEQRINYETEKYVAGKTTTIHKPTLSAPAIAPPQFFKTKTRYAAPEVTVHHSEVTVQENSPNYVDAPYDAGVVVEKAAPEINQVDVPTPVEVPHPVPVATPYHVKVEQPIKVKSSISPVVNVDVHSVQTENVVTPVEYTAHHHVATAPVVAATGHAVATGHYVAQAPQAVVYGAAVPTGQAGHLVTFGAGQAAGSGAGHVTYGAGQAATHGARNLVTFGAGQAATHSTGHLVTFGAGQAAGSGAGHVTYGAGQAATHGAGNLVTFGAGQAAGSGAGHVAYGAGQAATHGAGNLVTFGAGQAAGSGAGHVTTYLTGKQESDGQFVQGNFGNFVYPHQLGGHSFSVVQNPTVTTYSSGTGTLKDGTPDFVNARQAELIGIVGDLQVKLGDTQTLLGGSQTEMGAAQTELGNVQVAAGVAQTQMGEVQTNLGVVQTNLGGIQTHLGTIEEILQP